MVRTPRLFLTCALGAWLSACAGGTAAYPPDAVRTGGPVRVEVQNNSQEDVEVYLSRDGNRARLGVVLRGNTGNFSLQGATLPMSGRVQFALSPLGSGTGFVTEAVQVEGGETVVVNIGPEMSLTRVYVRR